MKTAEQKVIRILKENGGIARTRDFLSNGIHPRNLYRMRDERKLECISRGLYQIAEQIPDEPDMATICKKIPEGVICLISALSIHEITTEIPHGVHIALKRGSEKPRINYPPVQYYWMSGVAFTEGIERKNIGRTEVPVYCVEKTLQKVSQKVSVLFYNLFVDGSKRCQSYFITFSLTAVEKVSVL